MSAIAVSAHQLLICSGTLADVFQSAGTACSGTAAVHVAINVFARVALADMFRSTGTACSGTAAFLVAIKIFARVAYC